MTSVRQIMMGVLVLFVSSCFFSIAVNSLSLGLMAICWLLLMIMGKKWLVKSTPYDWLFAAYLLAEMLATLFSVNPEQSLLFSKRLLLIGIVYFFATHVTRVQEGRMVVVVLCASAVAVAFIGVVKWLFADPGDVVRLGIFQFYMTTSELMMIALLIVLPFVVHPGTPRPIRWAGLAALIPLGFALYATVTRGAYLAAAAGALMIAFARNWKLLIPLTVVVVLLVSFAPPYVAHRLSSIVDLSHPENASRVMLWKTGITIFRHYPVVGVGDIDLRELYDRFAEEENPEHHGHLHSVPLQILVTLGTVGFIAVYALFVTIAVTEWRIYRKVRDEWFRGSVVLGALAVFVGMHVMGLTEWSFGDQEVATVFWVTVGLVLASRHWAPDQFPEAESPAKP